MDEPLSNLDAKLRVQMRAEIGQLQRSLGVTTIYVTHDQTEAMTLADRIALMRDGKITQYDRPDTLYNEPATEFGGWFLGNPGMNFVPAKVVAGTITVPILAKALPVPSGLPLHTKLTVGIRPEMIGMSAEPSAAAVAGRLCEQTVGIAGRYLARVAVGEVTVKVKTDGRPPVPIGGTVHLTVRRDHLLLFADGNRVVR
jgi:ABC-type sugar transport system ATPase subunit